MPYKKYFGIVNIEFKEEELKIMIISHNENTVFITHNRDSYLDTSSIEKEGYYYYSENRKYLDQKIIEEARQLKEYENKSFLDLEDIIIKTFVDNSDVSGESVIVIFSSIFPIDIIIINQKIDLSQSPETYERTLFNKKQLEKQEIKKQPEKRKIIYCPCCGNLHEEEEKYCFNCGMPAIVTTEE